MERLRITLFGAFEAHLDGKPVVGFQSDKARALLAYLAVEAGQAHRRERLAGIFWPDQPERTARTYLRNALSNLRKVIADADNPLPHLLINPDAIQFTLASSVWVDVLEFNSLTRGIVQDTLVDLDKAINLQKQPFLQGFSLAGCQEFESWALLTRQNLELRLLTTMNQLCRQYELRGELGAAIEITHRQLSLDPFDEPLLRKLLHLLMMNGQRNAALEQFQTYRQVLAAELWVEPEKETLLLVENIKSGKQGFQPDDLPEIHNLPVYLTCFFGRQDEIRLINDLMTGKRLVTLSGPAGVGKTRLAVMIAETSRNNFLDGIWFIPLASLSDPNLVMQNITQNLGFHDVDQEANLEMMYRYLHSRSALLVIDNCEHVLNHVAEAVDALLTACPRLVILTTSRQPLGLFGETTFQVSSLPFPSQETELTLRDLITYPSINLFLDRTMLVKPDFLLDQRSAGPIVSICQRLDGIPLALELAASHMNFLSGEEIAKRLDRAFSLLSKGSKTAIPRHQTLQAALDWSYGLLSDKEALFLRRLAVFAGDWNLSGAEGICPGEGIAPSEVISLLSSLADKSMVNVHLVPGRPTRYRLLEVIRQYAEEKLVSSEETNQLQRRHLAYYVRWIEEELPQWSGEKQLEWMPILEADMDNFRKALAFGLESDPRTGLRLACILVFYWGKKDYCLEGIRWLKSLLNKPENAARDRLRAQGLGSLCFLASFEPDSERWAHECLEICRDIGDLPGQAGAYTAWGYCLVRREAFSEARKPLEIAREIFEELNNRPALASVLGGLAKIYQFTGSITRAVQLREQYLAIQREDAQWFEISIGCEKLSEVMFLTGDLTRARSLIEEAEHFAQQVSPGGYREGLAFQKTLIDCWSGNYDSVRSYLLGISKRRRKFESEGTTAYHKLYQGYFLSLVGQSREGKKSLEEGLRLFKTTRNIRYDLNNQQSFLLELTHTCIVLRDFVRARQLIDEFQHLYQLDYYHPKLQLLLGTMSLLQRNNDQATDHFQESLRIANKLKFRLQTLLALEGIAWASANNGQACLGAHLLGAAAQFRECSGAQVFPRDRPIHEAAIRDLKHQLGEQGYHSDWSQGFRTGYESVVQEVLVHHRERSLKS